MHMFWIAFSLFLIMDSVGCIPIFMSVLKDIPERRQYIIIVRELLIALTIIIIFQFAGNALLAFLRIGQDTVLVAGGVILFLLGLKMVFPPEHEEDLSLKKKQEPFIVPFAVPLIAGPATLAAVMVLSKQNVSQWVMLFAVLIAWGASLLILLLSPIASKKLGEKGIIAIERLMGLILIMMSIQMFLNGLKSFFAHA